MHLLALKMKIWKKKGMGVSDILPSFAAERAFFLPSLQQRAPVASTVTGCPLWAATVPTEQIFFMVHTAWCQELLLPGGDATSDT